MKSYSAQDILNILPHRIPMLMVDRVLETDGETICKAIKNISWGESCFNGHFPNNPIFPGVLTIEALAQTASILLLSNNPNSTPIFAGIESARFSKIITPGDTLVLSVKLIETKKHMHLFDSIAYVNDEIACSSKLRIALK